MTTTKPQSTTETLEPCSDCVTAQAEAWQRFSDSHAGSMLLRCEKHRISPASAAPVVDTDPPRLIGSSRHPHFTHADHERMKETLDALSDYPTEEEAEAVLQACGKEVVNDFIEQLLRENLELKTSIGALSTSARAAAEEIETHLGVLPFSLIDEIHERRQTIYRGIEYRVSPDIAGKLKTDLDYLMAFVASQRHSASHSVLDEIEASLISIADAVSPQEAVGKAFNIINAERAKLIGAAKSQRCIHCDPSFVPTGTDSLCSCQCHNKDLEDIF